MHVTHNLQEGVSQQRCLEICVLRAHVLTASMWRRYDIQEAVDKYQEFATKAGFGQAKEIAGDGNFMKVLAFTKEE